MSPTALIKRLPGLLLNAAGRVKRFGFPTRAIRRADLPPLARQAERCRADLNRFGRVSDEEFTALARGLASLNQRLSDVRALTGEIDRVLNDTDEDRALSSAYRLYKSTIDLVHSSMGIAISEHEELAQIEESLLHACCAREKFRRNHLLLRILIMSTRMEASRLDAEYHGVFLNVAAAIEEIDNKITNSTEKAFTRIESVIAEAKAERGDLKTVERDLQQTTKRSITTIERELGAVQTALQPCIEQSREITGLFSETGPQTLALLSSLQHQDIVRQQLEHIGAGFDDLANHFRAAAPGARGKLEPAYVVRAARLQLTQLNNSRAEIDRAGTEVSGGLQNLLDTGTKLIARFTEMERAATGAFRDCRVAEMFRAEIHQLAAIATQCKDANDRIAQLVERIREVVEVFSREIANHELDVKIVALNAQIAASRLPAADALNKLAEETSTVSSDNAVVTRELTAELRGSLDKLHHVKVEADTFLNIVSQEKAALESGVADVSARLHRLGERVPSEALKVRTQFEAAHTQTGELLAGLGFADQVADAFDPALAMCETLVDSVDPAVARRPLSAAAAAQFAAHEGRYTMQRETMLHAAAFETVPTPAVTASTATVGRPIAATPTAPRAAVAPPAAASANTGDIELF